MTKRIISSGNRTQGTRGKGPVSDSFLEALRNLGGGIAQEAVDQISGKKRGELKPNSPVDLSQIESAQKSEREFGGFQQEYLDIRRQERLVWSRGEEETKIQVKAILTELKKLSQSTQNLAKELKTASIQVPVEVGRYHLSFFERLRQSIILLKKQIDESATWLAAFNQKSKKRNYYWAHVRKSGTKFMLSQERYMSTQAG